jgi:hypothetical protein
MESGTVVESILPSFPVFWHCPPWGPWSRMQTHQQQIEENTKVSCCFARGHLGCSDAAWEGLRHTITTQKSVYTQQVFTHTGVFTQRSLLHKAAFTQSSFYTEKFVHAEALTQRSLFTEEFLHREVFSKIIIVYRLRIF